MVKRIIHGTFWLKVLAIVMVLRGASEKSAALLTGGVSLLICAKQIRDGIREQYWESEEAGYERRWTDFVWGRSHWVNAETPEQGIERLAGPYRQEDSWSADTGLPTATARSSSLLAQLSLPRRSSKSDMATGQVNPSVLRAPHLLG